MPDTTALVTMVTMKMAASVFVTMVTTRGRPKVYHCASHLTPIVNMLRRGFPWTQPISIINPTMGEKGCNYRIGTTLSLKVYTW